MHHAASGGSSFQSLLLLRRYRLRELLELLVVDLPVGGEAFLNGFDALQVVLRQAPGELVLGADRVFAAAFEFDFRRNHFAASQRVVEF